MLQLILALVLILAGLVGLGLMIGKRLPKTHVAASRIRLKAKPEEVWKILLNFENYPSWRMGLERVEIVQDQEGLPTWIEVCSEASKIPFRVVEAVSPKYLVTELAKDDIPLSGRWTYQLKEIDGGTELTIITNDRIFHPLLRFFLRFFVPLHAAMDVYLMELALKLGQSPKIEHLQVKYQQDSSYSVG
ncbi:MAG TPA: SRPBCC family protein [Methylothermaceae bacterium]|nr:SRPBCC family protein [Methylothermaceae bacterium]